MEKKCRRVGKWRPRLCDADTTDRLSYLPDFVLYHILSFVDTKTVVQTSVLSRRWRCVWKHVPALVFDSLSFDHHSKRFNTFVDKVLSLRYPTNVDKISYFNTLFYEIDEDEEIFRVSGLRLRTLNISCNQVCRIAINAPNLKSFVLHNYYRLVEFIEMDLPSLDHVDVLIEDESLDDDEFTWYAHHHIISSFTGLGNVTSCVMCSPNFKVRHSLVCINFEPHPNRSSY
ncbi:Putative FBD-associated F-box protein At5g56440 [Linum perenne]